MLETLAAEAAAEAELPFVAVLPFPDPEIKWPAATQRRFHELLAEASAIVRLEKKVPVDNRAAGQALDRRNGWLRKIATEAIVVWDHDEPRIGRSCRRSNRCCPTMCGSSALEHALQRRLQLRVGELVAARFEHGG